MIFPLLLSHYDNLIITIIIHRRYFPWNKPSRGTPPQQTPRTLKRRFCRSCGTLPSRCWRPWRQLGNPWKSENQGKIMAKWRFLYFSKTLNGYGSIPINTIFNGMNIHLPAILGFTRYQGFWHIPKSMWIWMNSIMTSRRRRHWNDG